MKNCLSNWAAATVFLISFWGANALPEEGGVDGIDQDTTRYAYRVIVDGACLDSDYRKYLRVSDVECTDVAKAHLEECRSLLGPILPGFGLSAHMQGGDNHPARVKSASFALIYCIQARSSFEPRVPQEIDSHDIQFRAIDAQSPSEIGEIRTIIAQLPSNAVEALFRLSEHSEFVLVWAAYGTQDIFGVVEEGGNLTSIALSNTIEWSSNMKAAGVRKVRIDKNRVTLVLDRSFRYQGRSVLVKISNRALPDMPVCGQDIQDIDVAYSQGGVCRIEGTKYADAHISWLSDEG